LPYGQSFGIEIGVPFELVFTSPIVLALGGTWYFFRQVGASTCGMRAYQIELKL